MYVGVSLNCCIVDADRAANAPLGDRAFPVAAARAWNAQPWSVRENSALKSSGQDVKTAFSTDHLLTA